MTYIDLGGLMKRVVSISIGSSHRDHRATVEILGTDFLVERIGTDGDIHRAIQLIEELDGEVDVFGLGGIDLYLSGKGDRRYILKSALPIVKAAKKTPIVDGFRVKDTIERDVVNFLNSECGISLKGKCVFLVSAMDRLGMAEAFQGLDSKIIIGDLMFGLGIPMPIYSIESLHKIAIIMMPIVSRLPFKVLYPTGNKQNTNRERFTKYYNQSEIIAGDFLYIKRHMPTNLKDKIILTNSVTDQDIVELRRRGVSLLVTSTPELDGRSFGTNVLEAIIISLSKKSPDELSQEEFKAIAREAGLTYRVEYLN